MWFAAVGALIIGVTLGLMGSGGSVLTVPVLTYVLGHDSKAAIAESLAIVGGIALFAMIPYARSRLVDWRIVVLFGVPGMFGAYLGAWLSGFVSGAFQLSVFAVVLIAAAFTMLKKSRDQTASEGANAPKRGAAWLTVAEGLTVGAITGLVGVGGGFLIVPALVLLGGLSMRVAVGTSLAVIALKSMSGLTKYLEVLDHAGASMDWNAVAVFILVGVIGSLFGKRLASRLDQQRLRQAFAAFLLVIGVLVIGKEAPQLLA